jgi:hypothetical protein
MSASVEHTFSSDLDIMPWVVQVRDKDHKMIALLLVAQEKSSTKS